MATDVTQRLREALVAILATAAGIVAVTGNATGNCVDWTALDEAARPVLAYRVITCRENGESGEGWDARVQLTAIAEDNDADAIVHELLGAARTALVSPAFLALAAPIDVAVVSWQRLDGSTDDQGEGDETRMLSRNLHVAHADVELTITA